MSNEFFIENTTYEIHIESPQSYEVLIQDKDTQLIEVSSFTSSSLRSYQKVLSGYSDTIIASTHNLSRIISYEVRKPTGERVEVQDSIISNSFSLFSNIDLSNHQLVLFGI